MTPRERVLCALHHEEGHRIPIHDSPWTATVDRWHAEGLPPDSTPEDYFGYEIVGFGADTSPRLPVRVIEETLDYVVATNPYGGTRKNHKDFSTTPEVIEYPCKSSADWEKLKERLVPSPDRFQSGEKWLVGIGNNDLRVLAGAAGRPSGLEKCREHRARGTFVCYEAIVGYDKMEQYVKTEELLMAIADDPEWVRDMYETDATMVIEMHRQMEAAGYRFNGAWLMCDLGYRNGLLFSLQHFQEQLRPTFRRLFDYFRSRGMPVILHSCGQVSALIPFLIADGLDCLQPLEVKAGMDLVALRMPLDSSWPSWAE